MKKKRTPWPRWAKVTRNLLLTALLGLVIWNQMGQPLPYEADIRRLERQWLMPEMKHVVEISRGIWGSEVRISWTEGAAVVTTPVRGRLFRWAMGQPYRLTDGPNLIALPWTSSLVDKDGQISSYAVYIALQPPEGSEAAMLTLHNEDGTFIESTVFDGQEPDHFLFRARPEPDENGATHMDSYWFDLDQCSYELAFYDGDGNVVGEVSG